MHVYLRTFIFVIFVPSSVVIYLPYFPLRSNLEIAALQLGPLRYGGIVPMTIGLYLLGWSIWGFASKGKGSPAMYIDEPKQLVTTGFYRITRNPMYVGVTLILFSEAILFQSATLLVYLLFWASMFHLQIVYREEPHLKEKFGAQYEEYLGTVPRWIPRSTRTKRRRTSASS